MRTTRKGRGGNSWFWRENTQKIINKRQKMWYLEGRRPQCPWMLQKKNPALLSLFLIILYISYSSFVAIISFNPHSSLVNRRNRCSHLIYRWSEGEPEGFSNMLITSLGCDRAGVGSLLFLEGFVPSRLFQIHAAPWTFPCATPNHPQKK